VLLRSGANGDTVRFWLINIADGYRNRPGAGSQVMQIWVDADACPKVIKEILFRAADRRQFQLTLVANKPLY